MPGVVVSLYAGQRVLPPMRLIEKVQRVKHQYPRLFRELLFPE
jgi:hypothetical protein